MPPAKVLVAVVLVAIIAATCGVLVVVRFPLESMLVSMSVPSDGSESVPRRVAAPVASSVEEARRAPFTLSEFAIVEDAWDMRPPPRVARLPLVTSRVL